MNNAFSRFRKQDAWIPTILTFGVIIYRLVIQSSYPLMEDELISIDVIGGVLDNLIPTRGDGTIYWRSLIGYYLMAIPGFFTSIDLASARIVPSIFAGLTSLPIYYLAKRQSGALGGVIAVLLLGCSTSQSLWANFARPYTITQFFFVLSTYLILEYFLFNRDNFFWPMVVAILCAVASHRLSIQLVFPLAGALVLGGRWRQLLTPKFISAAALIGVTIYSLYIYTPPSMHVGYSTLPLSIGKLHYQYKYLDLFRQFIPFGAGLIILGLLPYPPRLNKSWCICTLSFLLCLLMVIVTAPVATSRYFSNFFPLGILCCSASIAWIVQNIISPAPILRLPQVRHLIALFLTCGAIATFIFWDNRNISIATGTYFTYLDQKPAHEYIRNHKKADDLLITAEPGISSYYLGSYDFYLREKLNPNTGRFEPFPQEKVNKFHIDSFDKFKSALSGSKGSVWIYHNWKIDSEVGPLIKYQMQLYFDKVFEHENTTVWRSKKGLAT